ncbi:MAG: LysR family transcriptional regulator [Pasteurellaceae bacterium]|nr:LysR family transcriptional regulator [Pasteurellaceae bacterium]
MDKIQQLQLFISIVEMGSFSRTAERFELSSGVVSRQIQALETRLCVPLLHRTTRKLRLTAEGEQYYRRACDLLSDFDELENLFADKPENISGRILIDMPQEFAKGIVIPHFAEFKQRYPNIQLELSSFESRIDLLEQGVDCLLRVGTLDDSNLVCRCVCQLPRINCATPDYLRQFGTPKSLKDLGNHQLLVLDAHGSDGFVYETKGRNESYSMPIALKMNSSEVLFSALYHHLGIAQTPLIGVRQALAAGKLIEILPDYRPMTTPVYLVYRQRNLPKRVRVFADWLEKILAQEMA